MTGIGIIGFGNMGRAIYAALSEHFESDQLFVADIHREKLPLKNSSIDWRDIVDQVDVVILAIKPQSFQKFTPEMGMPLSSKRIISVMAGISVASIQDKTGSAEIVRTIPNLPLKVGKGLTGWMSNQKAEWAVKILRSLGQDIRVKSEEQLDAITAISGSGPAYFFLLCELLTTQAEAYGFSPEDARRLAEATFIGGAALLAAGTQSAAQLRQEVTSKGGTTNAAITYMQVHGFNTIFLQGIDQARQRAKELGN